MIWQYRAGLRLACVASVVAALAACSSTGGGSPTAASSVTGAPTPAPVAEPSNSGGSTVSRIADSLFGRNKADDIPQEYFLKKGYCPPIRVRSGTAVYTVYERGEDANPSAVRYTASIGKTARECNSTGSGLAIKVGVAGRAVGGPKATAGDVTLPVRVVVTRADKSVAYSQLFKLGVNLQQPDLSADFQHIVTTIDLPMAPNERDVTIYVGFDEGKPA